MARKLLRAAFVPAALIALGAFAVCQREAPPEADEIGSARRGTIRDRAGRVLAIDGDGGREYPFGHLGAHAIGYVRATETDQPRGQSGVEAAWDTSLRSTDGPPSRGRDVTMTIDMELMQIVERAFAGQAAGAVIVVDVHDGAIRALFSAPSFDPGELSRGPSADPIAALEASNALTDRTIGRACTPGGTMKTLTLLAGLEVGIDPSQRFHCRPPSYGAAFPPAWPDDMDARGGLASSCSEHAAHIGLRVGLDGLAAVSRDFGLGSRTRLFFGGEAAGFVPTIGIAADADWQRWEAASGQGVVAVTPMQVAMAYAAIANGGTLWRPRIVSSASVRDAPRVDHHVRATPDHLAFVRDALDAAVNDPLGTAYSVRSDRVRVAGKTGHGHEPELDLTREWFVGFAPADDPDVAIVVLLDNGYEVDAAGIAIEILEQYLAPL